ncbi:MAG TPA: hypothetical protein PLX35_08905 [Cyclobacteriaceae bacterium]|nr:hypothetical protein [Cyclobacteriaceae bacterium]
MNKKLILGLLVVAALLAGAGYAYREYYRPHVNMEDVNAAYDQDAITLIREFEGNEARANQKYLSQVLTVHGVIKAVDSTSGWVISLGDPDTNTSVRCLMDSTFRSKALKPGLTIGIKGYCTGFNADELLGSDVLLDRCVLSADSKEINTSK